MLNRVSLSVDVRKYDGDISSVTTINDGWGDTGQVRRIDDWKPGEKKSFTVTIPGNRLPTAGTYILRVIVTRWIPLGTPYEGIINELKKANIDKDTQKKVLKFTTEHWEEIGIDPHKMQIGGFKGELIFDGRVVDYCRVEEFSNLLNYWLVLATLLLVFATTLLALVPLISTPHSGSETGPAQHRLAYEKQH